MVYQTLKHTNKIIAAIATLLFSYTMYRAYVLAFTWDEAFSYLQYVRNKTFLIDKYGQMDANHHLLNTWLNILFVKWLGVNELVLRLPSLAGHFLFLLFSYKLIKGFQNSFLVISSFLVLNLNPYVLDFFSLSRGYGLSLGLMMASVYYIYALIQGKNQIICVALASAFGGLAACAHFVLLNYFILSSSLLLLLLFYNLWKYKKKALFFYSLIILTTITTSLLLFLVPILFKLRDANALFYGGDSGFWEDTFSSITERSLYELAYPLWWLLLAKIAVIFTITATSIFILLKIIKKQLNPDRIFTIILIVLLSLYVLSTILQHYVFGTSYLMERTALSFVVLFNLLFIFSIHEWATEKTKMAFPAYFAGAFSVFHFLFSFNLTYVLEWKSGAHVKQMLADLEQIKIIPKEKENINVGIPLTFEQSINYYRVVNNLHWVNTAERSKKINFKCDYLFLDPEQLTKSNADSIEIIKTYPLIKSVLAKPRHPSNLSKVCFSKQLFFKEVAYIIDEKIEYSQGFNYIVTDSIDFKKPAEIIFTADIMAKDISTCNLNIVVSFENKDGLISWKRAYVKDWIKQPNEYVKVCYTCFTPEGISAGDELKAYLWNPDKHFLSVKSMELKWVSKL